MAVVGSVVSTTPVATASMRYRPVCASVADAKRVTSDNSCSAAGRKGARGEGHAPPAIYHARPCSVNGMI